MRTIILNLPDRRGFPPDPGSVTQIDLAECELEECAKYFVPKEEKQRFCSPDHQTKAKNQRRK
jgi:hypothetical protein